MCMARGWPGRRPSLGQKHRPHQALTEQQQCAPPEAGLWNPRGTNASSLCCLFLLLPSSTHPNFYILLKTQLRCQGSHKTSMLPPQEITPFVSEHPGLFTCTSWIFSINWHQLSDAEVPDTMLSSLHALSCEEEATFQVYRYGNWGAKSSRIYVRPPGRCKEYIHQYQEDEAIQARAPNFQLTFPGRVPHRSLHTYV